MTHQVIINAEGVGHSNSLAKRIEEALNKRIEKQRKTFTDYTPAEMYKFEDCFVQINGTVVSYAICADNSKAKELLK